MSLKLRGWQDEAFGLYKESYKSGQKCCLWEATPGAGKTTAALHLVKHQIDTRKSSRALIVVPTTHLRKQWARSALRSGLHLDSAFTARSSRIGLDFDGAVVTYQQIANSQSLFKRIALESVVVLDEVHHAGDGLSWGDSLRFALGEARFILCLSGTAFRSDSNAIPFVRYDNEGLSVPDFSYSYARAIDDHVCRPTAFFTYGGSVAWSENDRVSQASFDDQLDPATAARRLRAALEPEAGWIEPMLRDAHAMLLKTRRIDPSAGGLVVCVDQTHARRVAELLRSITGAKPTVVLSDDTGASNKIKQYSESTSEWIIACNMVSEGVDIPRLRVGVYATTVKTKMYFRQFLGRIVRRMANGPKVQIAYLYLPADPTLKRLAEEIEEEIRHSIRPRDDDEQQDDRQRKKKDEERPPSSWMALSATNAGLSSVILNGSQLELFSVGIVPETVHDVVHKHVENRLEEGVTRSEQKARLSAELKRLVGIYARRTGMEHSAVYSNLNKIQKVKSQLICSEKQLEERISLVERMLSGSTILGRAREGG